MKCLATTTCPDLRPSTCPDLKVTECSDCPLDERPPQPCGQVTASGGQGTTKTRHGLGPTAGIVRITYDMYSIPDRLDCFYQGVLVASTGGLVSGSATLQWAYNPLPGDPTWCLVVMSAPNNGTAWVYTLNCPN